MRPGPCAECGEELVRAEDNRFCAFVGKQRLLAEAIAEQRSRNRDPAIWGCENGHEWMATFIKDGDTRRLQMVQVDESVEDRPTFGRRLEVGFSMMGEADEW
jgi:hypothetical protein